MINNPWLNRAAVLATLLMVYAAGWAGGKDTALKIRLDHPACQMPLRP
jgi:hypothetical protein